MNTAHPTILLYDDDPRVLAEKLRREGYKVLTAIDSEACLRSARSSPPIDLVLMNMELSDGTADMARLLTKEHCLPVIFLAPHGGSAIFDRMAYIKSYGCIEKGAEEAVLSFSINSALRLHQDYMEQKHKAATSEKALEEQKKTEKALRKSEQFYRLISENSIDVIWILDLSTLRFTYMSPSVYRLRGYTAEEVLNQTLEEIMTPECYQEMSLYIPRRLAAYNAGEKVASSGTLVIQQKHKNGSMVTTEIVTTVLPDENGKGKEVLGIARDISSRRKAEEALEKALEEKDILLKELQHRVKNSLSIIHSLVGLETNRMGDPVFKETLRNIQNRIRSLTDIYTLLCSSPDLNLIPLERYVRQISQSLVSTCSAVAGHIELHMELQEINIEVKRAIPLGLITNELLTNALKYAFPKERKGEITIVLQRQDGQVHLVVSDNGVGLPEDFDIEKDGGLGLELVQMLTEQIDGTLEIIKEVPSFVIKAPLSITQR